MMALLDIRAWLAIACAALVLMVAGQQVRVSAAKAATAAVRAELADVKTTYAQAAQKAEADARAEESRREAEKQEIVDDARKQAAEAIAAVGRADAAAASLRGQLARYVAAVRAASADSGTASGSPTAGDPARLLADLLGRADSRAGELAKGLDASRRAGIACEKWADALSR